LKVAITGLVNSGKTTVFNALSGLNLETTSYPDHTAEPHVSVVRVPDGRVDRLSQIFKPKKITYATIEYIDYIGLTKGVSEQNRKVFDVIRDSDAIVNVIRGFDDEAVIHPLSAVDPGRDAETIEMEMIFADLELIEKRLDRIDEASKKGKKQDETEKKLLLKCREILEQETPLRNAELAEDEHKALQHLQFISIKPVVIVLNIDEGDLDTERPGKTLEDIDRFFNSRNAGEQHRYSLLDLCGKIEMEIAQLPPDESKAFLDDLRIGEAARNKLIHASYELLGLLSFFTVKGDEVKAWTIKQGTNALKAAGKIHSDIERGFIKVEVVSFDDFIRFGSMAAVREQGLLRLEGKTYNVIDGDIMNFRFNV
jgi:GTP-binding protein YchF